MPSNDSLRAAVRGLRLALGKTQTEFGALIGKSLPTIQRYESLVPPKGKILLKLESTARNSRLDEYAQTFREAVRDELGVELPGSAPSPVPLQFPVLSGVHVAEPTTPEERLMHDALQALMWQTKSPSPNGDEARKEMKVVRRALRRVLLQLEDAGQGNQPDADRVTAIFRLRQDGLEPDQIARKIGMSRAEIEFLLELGKERDETLGAPVKGVPPKAAAFQDLRREGRHQQKTSTRPRRFRRRKGGVDG